MAAHRMVLVGRPEIYNSIESFGGGHIASHLTVFSWLLSFRSQSLYGTDTLTPFLSIHCPVGIILW